MTTNPTHPTDGPIHEHFGLSYCNYLVLPRTLLQSMPTEWQERMVACLEELDAAFQHVEQPDRYKVEAATEHIINEMTEAQLAEAGIEADWYGGETPPEGLTADEFAEWRAQHEQDRPEYYRIGDGEELDPHTRVLLTVPDPVPHYNRGRTYIEPRTTTPAS
jgi:predicted DNA-binding protein